MVRKFLLIALVITAMSFVVPAAYAAQPFLGELASSNGIEAGPVKLHVGVQLKLMHDTNIYTAENQEKDDNIAVLQPAVALTMKMGNSNLKAAAGVDIAKFSDNTKEDNNSNHGMVDYSVKSGGGFEFSLGDTYSEIEDVHPSQSAPKRAKHADNNLKAMVGFMLPSEKVKFEGRYSKSTLEFDDIADKYQNKEENTINIAAHYKMLSKTAALIELESKTIEYTDTPAGKKPDSSSTQKGVFLGLKWDPTSKLSGFFKVGSVRKEFDNAKVNRGGVLYNSDTDDFIGIRSQFTYAASSATKVRFKVNRSLAETTFGGTNILSASTHYRSNVVGFGFDQKVMDKVMLACDYSIQNDYYNAINPTKSKRSDTKHSLVISADYPVNKYTKAGAKIDYSNKTSDDPANEERRTIITANIKLMI